jgi:hypothetical protein
MQYFELLQDAIRYFDDPRREVRVLTGPFFHGKAYIGAHPSLKAIKRGVGSVGSSNFTYGGLVYNRELNMMNSDKEFVEDLIKWFYGQWDTSEDFKDQFLSFLKNYVITRSPYEVVTKALYETYKSSIEAAEEAQQLKTLYAQQASATPVNTGLMDLYFLFSLYLKEDSVFDLYGQTLRATSQQTKNGGYRISR